MASADNALNEVVLEDRREWVTVLADMFRGIWIEERWIDTATYWSTVVDREASVEGSRYSVGVEMGHWVGRYAIAEEG